MMAKDAVDPAFARGWVSGLAELQQRIEDMLAQNRATGRSPIDAGLTTQRVLEMLAAVQRGMP